VLPVVTLNRPEKYIALSAALRREFAAAAWRTAVFSETKLSD